MRRNDKSRNAILSMIIILILVVSTANAASVDLPDTNRITLKINPNAFVRVYETEDPAYYQYINGRYAYSLKFPSSFTVALQAGNSDGARFSTPDKQAELSVSGSHNTTRFTLNEYYMQAVDNVGVDFIAYKTYGDDWFVMSWAKDGKIFYRKVFVANYINSFTLSYPAAQNDQYSDVLNVIETSFVPGWKSGRKIWG